MYIRYLDPLEIYGLLTLYIIKEVSLYIKEEKIKQNTFNIYLYIEQVQVTFTCHNDF